MTESPITNFHFSPRPNRAHEIAWLPWGNEAFRRARSEGKPILLSLSAVWCHWCHVMDETSYSDPEVIGGLNRDYIPVRVDNDERPDINQRYNMGGWPSTVFLTPEGDVLAGATYVAPEQMRELVRTVAAHLHENRDELARRAAQMQAQRQSGVEPPRGPLSHEIFDNVVAEVERGYDPVFGGFGEEPKFPHVDPLDLLLLSFQRHGDRDHLHIARKSAEAMASGGLQDQIDGGFFRYSVARDWSTPHFEKLLEDQANLIRVYLRLYRATGEQAFRDTAERTITYVNGWLSDEQTGTFYGSQDADQAYYFLAVQERTGLAPAVDRRVYASWNAAMISTYIEASWTLDRPQLAERAARALDFVFERMRAPEGGLYHTMPLPEGPPAVPGLLADQVEPAHAALDMIEVLGRAVDFNRAVEMAALLRDRFQDGSDGPFFDIWDGAGPAEGRLAERHRIIGQNGRAAELFTRLYHLTLDDEYRRTAEAALAPFATTYHHYGSFAAGYARAADRLIHEPVIVNIVGPEDGTVTAALRDGSLRIDLPFRTVQTLDPDRDRGRLDAFSLPAEPAPRAYICAGSACSAPVSDPAELARVAEAMSQAVAASHHH